MMHVNQIQPMMRCRSTVKARASAAGETLSVAWESGWPDDMTTRAAAMDGRENLYEKLAT
jgi:hypothetical protein